MTMSGGKRLRKFLVVNTSSGDCRLLGRTPSKLSAHEVCFQINIDLPKSAPTVAGTIDLTVEPPLAPSVVTKLWKRSGE